MCEIMIYYSRKTFEVFFRVFRLQGDSVVVAFSADPRKPEERSVALLRKGMTRGRISWEGLTIEVSRAPSSRRFTLGNPSLTVVN